MGTAVDNKQETVSLLNNLIELDFDAIQAYEAAIARLADSRDQESLRQFMADHQRHTRDLGTVVQELGGVAATSGDIKQVLTKGRVVIAGLSGDKAILNAMKSNEDDTNKAYEKALATPGTSQRVHDILQRNLADERRHRAWIVQRLENMDPQRSAQPV